MVNESATVETNKQTNKKTIWSEDLCLENISNECQLKSWGKDMTLNESSIQQQREIGKAQL